jgi:hypothetical protein
MFVHAFPSMSVSSLREFPEKCGYRHGGFNCFIEYLHRKLLTTKLSLMILKMLKKVHVFNSSQNDHSKYFGTNQLFPLLKYMINLS